MSKKNKKTSYGIIGLGRFGYALATELIASNADIIVLDKDEEKVRSMREHTENAFVVSSLDKKTLLETGIQNCDTVIVCISEKMDVSILTTLHLKSMGVPTVIAKASSQEHGEVLEKLGAEVVYPERDMAIRTAQRASKYFQIHSSRLSCGQIGQRSKLPRKIRRQHNRHRKRRNGCRNHNPRLRF